MHPVVIAVCLRRTTQQHSCTSIGGSLHVCGWALFDRSSWKDDEQTGNQRPEIKRLASQLRLTRMRAHGFGRTSQSRFRATTSEKAGVSTVSEPCIYGSFEAIWVNFERKSRFPKLLNPKETKVGNGIVGQNHRAPKAGALPGCATPRLNLSTDSKPVPRSAPRQTTASSAARHYAGGDVASVSRPSCSPSSSAQLSVHAHPVSVMMRMMSRKYCRVQRR